MQRDELLRKAYMGEAIPGFIHNIGNPIGALLGFITILKDEADNLKEAVAALPEGDEKTHFTEISANINEFLGLTVQSEQSVRSILDRFTQKWNKDSANEIGEINLPELVAIETDIMTTNRFFKHKIKKNFQYGEYVQSAWGIWRSASQPVSSLLMMYTAALENVKSPTLTVKVYESNGKPFIEIAANTRLAQDIADSFPGPVLTLKECIETLRPIATLRYAEQDEDSSVVTIEFAGSEGK
jgi:hypothetical protein